MLRLLWRVARPVHFGVPAASLVSCIFLWLLASGAGMAGAAVTADDHQQAVAALTDVKAAVAELVRADASYAADPKMYHDAAQRAINALEGAHDEGYIAGAGTPGDAAGAIGHINTLLDRADAPVWTATLESAEANIRAAVSHLQDATKADELMDYATAASRALDYLQVARGRPNETGVFGGLEGVLANTALGVPAGARQQDACQAPIAAPSYGTHGDYIAWVALPGGGGPQALPQPSGASSVSLRGGMIVVHTAAAKLVAAACGAHAEAAPPISPTASPSAAHQAAPPAMQQAAQAVPPAAAQPAAQAAPPAAQQAAPAAPSAVQQAAQAAPSAAHQAAQAAPAAVPPLYTKAQAEQGAQIFATKCVGCHGTNLQGTAAPSVAGNDFLLTAQHNGWTLAILRYIVFDQMPRNSPASLSPQENAAVMAFLLAANCYPAGTKPFPAQDEPSFANIKLGPIPGQHQDRNAKGVCKVD